MEDESYAYLGSVNLVTETVERTTEKNEAVTGMRDLIVRGSGNIGSSIEETPRKFSSSLNRPLL